MYYRNIAVVFFTNLIPRLSESLGRRLVFHYTWSMFGFTVLLLCYTLAQIVHAGSYQCRNGYCSILLSLHDILPIYLNNLLSLYCILTIFKGCVHYGWTEGSRANNCVRSHSKSIFHKFFQVLQHQFQHWTFSQDCTVSSNAGKSWLWVAYLIVCYVSIAFTLQNFIPWNFNFNWRDCSGSDILRESRWSC